MWKKSEIENARRELRQRIRPGQVILTRVNHVSRSGMLRIVEAYLPTADGIPENISYKVAQAIDTGFDHKKYGIKIGGCGFSAEFQAVYSLGQALFRSGFMCIGTGCPSNDHANGDRDYSPHMHTSGGYALRQRSF